MHTINIVRLEDGTKFMSQKEMPESFQRLIEDGAEHVQRILGSREWRELRVAGRQGKLDDVLEHYLETA